MVCHDDNPVAIYGLTFRDMLSGIGSPWMLTANGIENAKRELITDVMDVLGIMLTICPTLVNHVHVENRMSVKWLRRLGFVLEAPEPIGLGGEMFHKFSMVKEDV